jgi:hypothetical protein
MTFPYMGTIDGCSLLVSRLHYSPRFTCSFSLGTFAMAFSPPQSLSRNHLVDLQQSEPLLLACLVSGLEAEHNHGTR